MNVPNKDGTQEVFAKVIYADWIYHKATGKHTCSSCGRNPLLERFGASGFREVQTPFCPWCGAVMMHYQGF